MTDPVNDGPAAPRTADAGTDAIMRILDLAEDLAPLTGASHREATRYAAELYARGVLGFADEMARDEARDMLTIPSYLEAMADIVHRQAAERAEYEAHLADVIPLDSRRRIHPRRSQPVTSSQRCNEADALAFETVFGVWSDDPENALCIVCGDPLDLPDPNSLLCPDCRGRADHHDKEN